MNPSSEHVDAVRAKMQLARDSGAARGAQDYALSAAGIVLRFVATMSHADVLTAQRMAREVLRVR